MPLSPKTSRTPNKQLVGRDSRGQENTCQTENAVNHARIEWTSLN